MEAHTHPTPRSHKVKKLGAPRALYFFDLCHPF